MAIQLRRGAYADFDPQKMKPAEVAVVQGDDPTSHDGKAVYVAISPGDVKRMAVLDELQDEVYNQIDTAISTATQAAVATATQAAAESASEAAASASAAAESARTLTIDSTLTQPGQPADAKVVGDKIEGVKGELNDILVYNENMIQFTSETFIKRSSSADPSSITYYGDGIDITHGNANAYYGVRFNTKQGKTYKIELDIIEGSSSNVSVKNGDVYVSDSLVQLTANDNHYSGEFIAVSDVSSVWVSLTYSVAKIAIRNCYVYTEGYLPHSIKSLNSDMIPIEINAIKMVCDVSKNIMWLSDHTLRQSGQYFLSNISFTENGFTSNNGGKSVYFGFVFHPFIGSTYIVDFDSNSSDIDNLIIVSGEKFSPSSAITELSIDQANHVHGQFVAPSDLCSVWMRQKYSRISLTVSNFTVRTKDELSNIKSEKIPKLEHYHIPEVGKLDREFYVTAKHIFIINGIDDFWIYNHGLCKSDYQAYDYAIRQYPGTPNILNYSDAIPGKIRAITENVTNGIFKKQLLAYTSRSGDEFSRGDIVVKCATKPSNPEETKHVLFVGDSFVANNVFPKAFKDMLDNLGLTNIALIGRKTHPTDPNVRYEATGGYAWPDYAQDPNDISAPIPISSGHSNPFWINNSLDIKSYCDTYCNGVYPDYVICNLSWNMYVNSSYSVHVGDDGYDIAVKTLVTNFIDAVRTASPNAKIIINGMHHGCDGKMAIYPSNVYVKGAYQLADIYMDVVNDADYSGFVEYCDVAPYFDSVTGMNTSTRVKNSFTEETEKYVTDYVHPSEVGYKQHALADICCFLYMLAIGE